MRFSFLILNRYILFCFWSFVLVIEKLIYNETGPPLSVEYLILVISNKD